MVEKRGQANSYYRSEAQLLDTDEIIVTGASGGGGARPRVETDWLNTSLLELSHIVNKFLIVVFYINDSVIEETLENIDDQIVIFIFY